MTEFGEMADQYEPHDLEEEVFTYWDAVDAYEQTKQHREGDEPYFFVDGPPYTNGSAHMGHAWNKSLKDCYIRFRRMQGYDVHDRPGYDMHGLPIETRVEENLGFSNKKDIEAFGEDEFIEACKEYAEGELKGLQASFIDFGVWMDWDNPYKTLNPEYMEATWWGFSKAHERGLVEQGNRSIAQCPRCETAIAKNEIEYEDVSDPSIYVAFDLIEREGAIVIWTTTPWTIPANAFVAVDPSASYVGVQATDSSGNQRLLYVAEAKVDDVMDAAGIQEYEVVSSHDGDDLIGWQYEHPLAENVPDHPDHDGSQEIYAADYVEVEGDGTGLVHSAPGHGEEDFERGTELGFPIVCPVQADGRFDERGGAYAGQFVKDADAEIIADLDAEGALIAQDQIHHSYGHCWRCDTGIVQIVTEQWFITVTDVKDELLDNIGDSEWYPSWARDNRFRDFVEEAPDWNVSRQRYWGTPIPIWLPPDWNGDMDEAIVIGDRAELAERVDQDIDPTSVDLHKDTVDHLTITENGTTYERVPDVFDVWLDSSVASWGTLDFPSDDSQFDELWPADLIIEAHDQTRGWFWSQLGMGTAALDEIPYRDVLMYGFALMPDGRAMSKSKGLIIDPHEAIDQHGRDVMRLLLLSHTPQGEDMRVSFDEMEHLERQLRTLWNVAKFPLPYMRLDDFDPQATDLAAVDEDLEVVDEWILARLQTTIEEMNEAFDEYRQDRAIKGLLEFVVEDLSRFYVQVVRERMWREDDDPSKLAAYATMYHVLHRIAVLLAPFTPFVSEKLYQTLTGDRGYDTVHMNDWPEVDPAWVDDQLEADVDLVRSIEEAGANARQEAGRKLRWPVTRVVVDAQSEQLTAAAKRHTDLIADRLNARSVEVIDTDDAWGELAWAAEADMSVLGPSLGANAEDAMRAMNEARLDAPDLDSLEAYLEDKIGETVDLDDETVTFVARTPDATAGTPVERDGDDIGVVYIDATLTEEIEREGYAREVIRRIQEMRKTLELDLEASIRVDLSVDDERIATFVDDRRSLIAQEVRADEFGAVEDGLTETWEIEGVDVTIAIAPIAEAPA